jgi:hypothetical protein
MKLFESGIFFVIGSLKKGSLVCVGLRQKIYQLYLYGTTLKIIMRY